MLKFFIKYASLFITLVVFLYVFIAFLSPVLMKYGNYELGVKIQVLYEQFCHQRVERSLFLFSKDSLFASYENQYLQDIGYYQGHEVQVYDFGFELPSWIDEILHERHDGHGLWGDEDMGFKVAICIRDIALYGGFLIVSVIVHLLYYIFRIYKKISFKILIIFLLPIFLDVLLQIVLDGFNVIPQTHWFYDNWMRRSITGVIAGGGIAIYVAGLLLTNVDEKERM